MALGGFALPPIDRPFAMITFRRAQMLRPPKNADRLLHGDKVWTHGRTPGVERHYGIWDEEERMFLHNDLPGGVQYVTPEKFINREFFVEANAKPGSARATVELARALIGTPYNLLNFNCEHYVNVVHDGKRESPQLQRAAWITALFTFGVGVVRALANAPRYNAEADRYYDPRTGRFTSG